MVEVELGDVLRSRVGPKLFVRSVTHPKLDDLARIYLELGLDAVVPNVIEGIRANGMEGAPSASRGVVSIAPRSHFSPSRVPEGRIPWLSSGLSRGPAFYQRQVWPAKQRTCFVRSFCGGPRGWSFR